VRRSVYVSVRCGCTDRAACAARADSPAALPSILRCPACSTEKPLHLECVAAEGGLRGCLVCGHLELYTRKRFPSATGIAIVIVAALYAPSTHYLSLAAAALLDFALYRALPDEMVCYVCGAGHRGFAPEPRHPGFDREIAERLRFGDRAVMGKPMRAGGTAGGPDPEH